MNTILLTFKRYSDADLHVFSENVVEKTKGVTAYVDEQAQILIVEAATQAFAHAILEASTRDIVKTEIRNQKRILLLNELVQLAKLLQLHTGVDEDFFLAAGFDVRKTPVNHLNPLPRPVLRYIRQGVLSGSVDGESLHWPPSVKEIAAEYSSDNGQSWKNSTYSTGKRFNMDGLTPRNEYLVRIAYQGTRQRASDWSEPMGIFVL